MPYTKDLQILIDGQPLETGPLERAGVNLSYGLEDPENFEQKQSSMSLGISLPATPVNDRIFNSFHDPSVEDMTPGAVYGNLRRCNIVAGGIEVLRGVSMLQSASHTRLAAGYNINCYGQNGDWAIDMKDLTLWHCLNDATHTFDVATVEGSWYNFMYSEAYDYVYAPVRYRQPFGDNDDTVNIYHLRPSLSIYWMIQRAFRQLGYKVKSNFFETDYFKGLVLPWVWGDFFDLNGSVKEGLLFKAAGPADKYTVSTVVDGGSSGSVGYNNAYRIAGSFSGYVFSYVGVGPAYWNFRVGNTNVPNGNDNFDLYEFDEGSGTMKWTYNPPPEISSFVGNNITANFKFNLIAQTNAPGGHSTRVRIEVTHVFFSGAPTTVTLIDYDTLDLPGSGTKGNLLEPIPFSFPVSGISQGDRIELRLKIQSSGAASCSFELINSQLITLNPGSGTPQYSYIFSTLEITSLQLELGGTVNLKFYDKFKSYKFLDMLRGLVDMFNLAIQTNPIDKEVTIEPTHEYKLPGIAALQDGYFKRERLDWTGKQDLSKESVMSLFSESERQLDMQFKQDGSDGGQNIYAARYRGIYLNNTVTNRINNTNIDNGIFAGVPGAARYMFPMRFRKGNKQMTNRFFSATMHYVHKSWKGVNVSTDPAPQLIAIFPESINDSSGSAITQTFEPKIAFYKGVGLTSVQGGWRWIGDPAAPYSEMAATAFELPLMFAVNYGTGGENDPVLTYCDQKINGNIVPGLMRNFFLKRLAIMRSGKQYKTYMRVNNGDMTNWLHRERIIINGAIYNLISVDNYNPLSDNPALCTFWKDVQPLESDQDAIYPSADALNGVSILGQFDLRYAPLILYNTDLPQVQ